MTKIFAQRLKEARLAMELSPVELAKKSGVAYNTIYVLENGKNLPNLYTTVALDDALEVSIDWLAGRSNYGSKEA